MNSKTHKKINEQRARRVRRVRVKISGTAQRPRLAVHRSLRYVSAQLIDDDSQKTLVSVHQRAVVAAKSKTKRDAAVEVGKELAKKAKAAGISQAVFDRRHYAYHGRVEALAQAAREEGLAF